MQYQNDTQEIDMEFLSVQDERRDNKDSFVNLVIHSKDSQKENYDASKTSTFDKLSLPYSPSEKFHEYRMDYLPESVDFYVDGKIVKTMKENVPDMPGRLF